MNIHFPIASVRVSPRVAGWVAGLLMATTVLFVEVDSATAANPRTTNPNHTDTDLPMAVHGEKYSTELHAAASARYEVALKGAKAAVEKDSKGQVNRIEPKTLGDSHVACRQIMRMAEELRLLGEPAGVDFDQRAQNINQQVVRIAQDFARTPEGATFLGKARQFINNTQKDRQESLKRIEKLVTGQKWKEAETTLHGVHDKYMAVTVFMTPEEQRPVYEPFLTVTPLITQAMTAIRAKESAAVLSERLTQLAVNAEAPLAKFSQLAPMLATAAKVDLEGQQLSGPELATQLAAEWQKTHVAVQRHYGQSLASQSFSTAGASYIPGGGAPAGPGQPADPSGAAPAAGAASPIDGYVKNYSTRFLAVVDQLVAAEAQRATADEAPNLYAEYVKALALTSARTDNSQFAAALQASLNKLAAKSPAFANEAAGYAEATDELLRWRRRAAESFAKSQSAKFPAVSTVLQPALTSKSPYIGLFQETGPDVEIPQIFSSAPNILTPAVPKIVGQSALLTGGRGLAGGKSSVTTMQSRTYGTLKSTRAAIEAQLQGLRGDLFVTDAAGPLSLNAAMAIQSADAGDFDAAGGQLTGLHLEGFVTRLITLPDVVWPLVPLGRVPVTPARDHTVSPLTQAVIRVELQPTWVQHRAFFAVLPAPTSDAGAE